MESKRKNPDCLRRKQPGHPKSGYKATITHVNGKARERKCLAAATDYGVELSCHSKVSKL